MILERSHSTVDSPVVTLTVSENHLELALPEGWLESHPLSARELEVERVQLKSGGFALELV